MLLCDEPMLSLARFGGPSEVVRQVHAESLERLLSLDGDLFNLGLCFLVPLAPVCPRVHAAPRTQGSTPPSPHGYKRSFPALAWAGPLRGTSTDPCQLAAVLWLLADPVTIVSTDSSDDAT